MAEHRIFSIALQMIDVSATGLKLATIAFDPPFGLGLCLLLSIMMGPHHHPAISDRFGSILAHSFFSYRVIQKWNLISADIKTARSLEIFKNKLDEKIMKENA